MGSALRAARASAKSRLVSPGHPFSVAPGSAILLLLANAATYVREGRPISVFWMVSAAPPTLRGCEPPTCPP